MEQCHKIRLGTHTAVFTRQVVMAISCEMLGPIVNKSTVNGGYDEGGGP